MEVVPVLIAVCTIRISHVKGHIGVDEDSFSVNDLIIPANKLVPLMRPDSLGLLIDVFVRLGADVVVASLDRKVERLQGYRAGRRVHGTFVLGADFRH